MTGSIIPFIPTARLLEMLQERATPYGYVDLEAAVSTMQLEAGSRTSITPTTLHWNFPAAQMAAEELTKAARAFTLMHMAYLRCPADQHI